MYRIVVQLQGKIVSTAKLLEALQDVCSLDQSSLTACTIRNITSGAVSVK